MTMGEVPFRELVEAWQRAHDCRHEELATARREAWSRHDAALGKIQADLADLRRIVDQRLGTGLDRETIETRIGAVQAWSDRVHQEHQRRLEAIESHIREEAGHEAGSRATWQVVFSIATLAVAIGVGIAKWLGI